VALEIALCRHVVVAREERGIVRPEDFCNLGERPDIELALLAFGIGIERGAERAIGRRHLAREPGHGLLRARAIKRFAGALIRKRQELQELGIVVEHLLEVRDQPALVDRVAREAAAEMVIDAALRDALKRQLDRVEIARLAGALPGAPEELEQHRLRELGGAAGAAMDRIDDAAELLGGAVELRPADHHPALRPRGFGKPRHQGRSVLLDRLGVVAEDARNVFKHIHEGGLAVAAGLRKIRAAPERLACGREEHRQRPAAVLAHEMQRRHVDLVDVGPLLAVDLDVDEQRIHHLGGGVVLEALVRHHVAPVAGRVADREQDRLVGALRLGERLRPPRPPVDRIVLVLQEIRRGLLREAVFGSGAGGGGGHEVFRSLMRRARITREGRDRSTGSGALPVVRRIIEIGV